MSFASPPVDTAISAVSYPSSPESTRSPPPWQAAQPATSNYRTAFQNDPFEGLGQWLGDEHALQEARSNAQNNATTVQSGSSGQAAIQDTLSRFVSAPARAPAAPAPPALPQSAQPTRQSMDVDAFTRLLLTGDKGTAAPAQAKADLRFAPDNSSSADSNSISRSSVSESHSHSIDDTPRSSHEQERPMSDFGATRLDQHTTKAPPPAPAPRRVKTVKATHLEDDSARLTPRNEQQSTGETKPLRSLRPPTPPMSRRHSHQAQPLKDENILPLTSEANSTIEFPNIHRAPPPPPIRRQHSAAQRRPSNELESTLEEPDPVVTASPSSRRSSADRPQPPPTRNSSTSVKRQSLGLMQPPPVPPQRRGRGSSRSSMDTFRPSLSSVLGEHHGQNVEFEEADTRRISNQAEASSNASNTNSILAELANLQKEVDAARRSA